MSGPPCWSLQNYGKNKDDLDLEAMGRELAGGKTFFVQTHKLSLGNIAEIGDVD